MPHKPDRDPRESFSVRANPDESALDACYLVRMAVFVEEQKVPPWEEVDAYDETARHFAVESGGLVVGTARLVDLGGGVGKIGRVAVLAEHRGKGAGRALMETVIDDGFRRFRVLTLDAQLEVIPFYEKLGFIAEGPVFLDAGIEHRKMTAGRPNLG